MLMICHTGLLIDVYHHQKRCMISWHWYVCLYVISHTSLPFFLQLKSVDPHTQVHTSIWLTWAKPRDWVSHDLWDWRKSVDFLSSFICDGKYVLAFIIKIMSSKQFYDQYNQVISVKTASAYTTRSENSDDQQHA